ncbi:hypothetical protein GGR58DRAFT_522806 [Xylaria digitata]|nr:hypothetical protein GGR58DRAFT_522806 [Xylaria digitata]
MFYWLDGIIEASGWPLVAAAPRPSTTGKSRPAVGEAAEDPRRGERFSDNGFEKVYSTAFSQGTTVWFSYFPEPPLPAEPVEEKDGTLRLNRGLEEDWPTIPLSDLPCHQHRLKVLPPSFIPGDTWPQNRIPPLPPPPPQAPLPLLLDGKRMLGGCFRDSAASGTIYPEYPRPQLRSSFAQPPMSTPRGTTAAVSTHEPSNTDAPEILSSSYSHGLAMARSGGHDGIIEPLRPLNPPGLAPKRSEFAPRPSKDPLLPTIPEQTLEKSPQEEPRESVERGRRRQRQPRRKHKRR